MRIIDYLTSYEQLAVIGLTFTLDVFAHRCIMLKLFVNG